MKKLFRFPYQSEIRLSLLLLILFFVLINYEIGYLLNLSKNGWMDESTQSLRGIAYSASQLWQKSTDKSETNAKIKSLASSWGISRVDILDKNGEILTSSDVAKSKGTPSSADSSLLRLKHKLTSGKSFFSDIYRGSRKRFYQSYFYAFTDERTQNLLFSRVEKDVTTREWIERISKYEGWVRGLGILLIVLISFFLLKNIFSPYQKMKRKAEDEKIIAPSAQREDVEVVVEAFQKVIAELKEKEKKLQELYVQTDNKAKNLEKYNEYILKSINNGVIICDNQGRITGFNQSAQRLLGPNFDLSPNLHYKKAFGLQSSLSNMLDEMVIKKHPSSEAEIEIKNGKSENKFLLANSALLRDEAENIIGLVLVLTDLTELKKIQQEIAQKQKMASIGEISAGLAHELRNSMGALLGYCKMLKKGFKEGTAAYPIVESIQAESLTLENLLQRFLDFAKPLEIKPVNFDLAELIQDTMKIAQEKRATLRFHFNLQEGIPPVTGDPLLLRQVFQNLIQNSVEALPADGEIRIELKPAREHGEPMVLVIIRDNGCGIPEENLGQIFKPFFTSKEKGVGLGLSLVKKIIDLHKGKIEVKSEQGKGTVFSVFLPMAQAQSIPELKKSLDSQKAEIHI